MDKNEHYLLLMMFVRMHEYFQVIRDTLKSRGIWDEGDQGAFSSAVHLDREKLRLCLELAKKDYFQIASTVGVVTGLEDESLHL